MKEPGWKIIVACLIGFNFIAGSVCANPINLNPPDFIADVHIEKDSVPYMGNITYSMKCYGHTSKQIYASPVYLRNKTKEDPDPPELVFYVPVEWTSHFTKMCDSCYYGYYYLDPDHSELCQLNGTTDKGAFSIWNSTNKPVVKYTKRTAQPYDLYDFYFTLPSDNQTSEVTIKKIDIPDKSPSFIDTLYCSILNIFGARCD